MDKSWMQKPRLSSEYNKGVLVFNFAFGNVLEKSMLPSPCIRCNNCLMQNQEIMYNKMLDNGVARNYVRWLCMENMITESANTISGESNTHNEMQEMLTDAFEMSMSSDEPERGIHAHEDVEKPNEGANFIIY